MSSSNRCAKTVFSGERWDIGGHRCGRKPLEGSQFCSLHDPEAVARRLTDAKAQERPGGSPSSVKANTRVTLRLVWEDEETQPRWTSRGKLMALTHLTVTVLEGELEQYVKAVTMRPVRKDGTLGYPVTGDISRVESLPESVQEQVRTLVRPYEYARHPEGAYQHNEVDR